MTSSATGLPNLYAVELTPPDISAYAAGNTGVPYVWTFDSGAAGPHVAVTAIVHGNEPCGAIALDWLMQAHAQSSVAESSPTEPLSLAEIAALEAEEAAEKAIEEAARLSARGRPVIEPATPSAPSE